MFMSCFFLFFFFFFQAEDGIRDLYVTGVQTCALPISMIMEPKTAPKARPIPIRVPGSMSALVRVVHEPQRRSGAGRRRHERSEERRVGKECRSRWSP